MFGYKKAIITVAVMTVAVGIAAAVYTGVTQYRQQGVLVSYSPGAVGENKENEPININTASLKELSALDGIGEVKAAAIIAYREQNGRFESVEELLNIKGFGEKTLEAIRDNICI